ncbi:MAG: hypothetical protein AAGK04_00140 [Planctomycetota bacterium]
MAAASHIQVGEEREGDHGWSYAVVVTTPDGTVSTHEVALSWVDHDHWSAGTSSPSRVVESVLHAVLTLARPPELPAKFDLATARRWAPDLDERLML